MFNKSQSKGKYSPANVTVKKLSILLITNNLTYFSLKKQIKHLIQNYLNMKRPLIQNKMIMYTETLSIS